MSYLGAMQPVPLGTAHTVELAVPERFTVPGVMPDVPSWAAMPRVLATSMLVAIMEWAALELLVPFHEGDEQSLGIFIDVSHNAPSPAGVLVRATATLNDRSGRYYDFRITAHDENGPVGEARHRRAIINRERFEDRVLELARRPIV